MKLYEVPWSIHPRRVGVYLAEKGIEGIERVPVPPPPPDGTRRIIEGVTIAGTVPALDIGAGQVIGSSLAILEYLEERFPSPDLIGATPAERARTREFITVIEEATVYLRIWAFNGSRLFAAEVAQDKAVARAGMAAWRGRLQLLERMVADRGGAFLTGDRLTTADCVGFALLQTTTELFGVPIPEDCPGLQAWYRRFSARPSGAVPDFPPVLGLSRGLVEQTQEG